MITGVEAVAGAIVGAGAVAGTVVRAPASVPTRVPTRGIGVGFEIRAIIFRLSTTLRFFVPDGILSLPSNWRENNFVIDAMTPAEFMPGIGKHDERFTLKSVINELKEGNIEEKSVLFPFMLIWFILASLYRMNIKATCWFYWPLAFLLRPLPTDDRSERRRRDLCWPWTNPAQLLLIIGSGIFGLVAVFISF